jgi:PilZ domain
LSASSPGTAKKSQSVKTAFDRRRRKAQRYLVNFPVVVVSLSDHGYVHLQGSSQDLSEAGMGVLLSAEILLGEVVTLGFTLPPVQFDLRAVVRHRRACRYGLEFLGLTADQKARLAEFVKGLPAAD